MAYSSVKVISTSHMFVAAYNLGLNTTKIAYCRHGDEEWRALDCGGHTFYDVVGCDRTNTLLALGAGLSVQSWDFNETIPKKTVIIQDSFPKTLQLAHQTFPTDLYTSRWYLASSPLGEIYMIVRYIGEFVRYDGEVVYEADTLTDYAAEPLVCPYKTLSFHVFRLDLDRREWVDVESLDGFAVFVGVNQSTMVSAVENAELKKNSIYFTDDYWERIDEDYSYGGHDLGIYSIGDGSIEPILDSNTLMELDARLSEVQSWDFNQTFLTKTAITQDSVMVPAVENKVESFDKDYWESFDNKDFSYGVRHEVIEEEAC